MLTSYEEDTLKAFSNGAVKFKNEIIQLTCVGIIQIRTLDTKQQYIWWCEEFCHRLVRQRRELYRWKVKKKRKRKVLESKTMVKI